MFNQKRLDFRNMFYNILDEKRKDILPLFRKLKNKFYLAGGTALALQLGHRDSVDFDFFSEDEFDTRELFEKLKILFQDFEIKKVQDEKNTLTIIVDKNVKLSFFTYEYTLLNSLLDEKYIRLASLEDIACMKLSAIVSRSTEKDYVDLYFILQNYKLKDLLNLSKKKFPTLDTNLIIKSLTYFDDIIEEEIIFKNNNNISLVEIETFLEKVVRDYLKK